MLSKDETLKFAQGYASKDFLCSESVLMALSNAQNIRNSLIPRIATGFGSGCGRCGEICGAISGAIMGLGIKYGRNEVKKLGHSPYWYSTRLIERFKDAEGAIRCSDLLGFELSTQGSIERYHSANLWEKKCIGFILKATEIAFDILSEKNEYDTI